MKLIKKLFMFILPFLFLSCSNAADSMDNISGTMSSSELAVLAELNYARTKPSEYASQVLQPRVAASSGEYLSYLTECISEMQEMSALSPLQGHDGLTKAAAYWVKKQGPTGNTGHDSNLWPRVKQTVSYKKAGENIAYGNNGAREIIVQLLVDNGVETRGHRKNILNSEFTHVGISIGTHSYYKYMCVQDFAKL